MYVKKDDIWNYEGVNYIINFIFLCLDIEYNYFIRERKLKYGLKIYLILVNLDILNIGYYYLDIV